jgi:hypothetical protein
MRNVPEKKSRRENKTHTLCSITCFPEIQLFGGHVDKYSRPSQATDDNVIRRVLVVSRKTRVTDANSEYVLISAF